MALPTLIQQDDGYWLLLKGADHSPTMNPYEIARRIQAVTNAPERYQYLVDGNDADRLDFRLTVAEERRRLQECWEAEVQEAESILIPWYDCTPA